MKTTPTGSNTKACPIFLTVGAVRELSPSLADNDNEGSSCSPSSPTKTEYVEGECVRMAKKTTEVITTNYPEVGSVTESKVLKKHFKNLTNDQLDEWISIEGIQVTLCGHAPIDRMRKCMAITAKHFPPAPKATTKSRYSNYTTEELVQMAMDNNVEIRDDKGDMRILRMYTIVALREAGLLA